MVFSSFWKNSQKPPDGFECAARRMSDNPILGFSVMNSLAARVTPLGDANTMQKSYYLYFSHNKNHRAQVLYPGAKLFNSGC